MKPRTILFFAKVPMNYVLFEPVHARLAGDARLALHFTGKFQGRSDPRRVYAPFDLRGGRIARNGLARLRRWDVYVSPDYRLAGKRARVKVHMFHGFSIRNFAIQERARDFDRLFLLGPYMERRFVERGILAADDPRIERVGMPKLDALVRGEHARDAVLTNLGLNPDLRTVLFAPTWIRGGCLDVMGEDIARALARLPLNVIVKLHDNSLDARKQRTDFGRVLPPLLGARGVLARGFDSNPLLAAADVLVSDASSVANEFLVLDRPLIFFRVPDLEKDWPATDRDTWGTRTGTVIGRPEELERAVFEALERPAELSALRREAAADFFFDPGRAAERAATRLRAYAGVDDAEPA